MHSKEIKSCMAQTFDSHLSVLQFPFFFIFYSLVKTTVQNHHVISTSRILPNYTVSLGCSQRLPQ